MYVMDEAHGAFGYFCEGIETAMNNGADMVCLSAHKSIGGMWGKSFILNSKTSRISDKKFMSAVDCMVTTSMSMGSLADLESVIMAMAENGHELFREAGRKANKVREAFLMHPKMMCLNPKELGLVCDPTKVTFGINGLDSHELDVLLKHPNVNIRTEITSINGVVAIINPMMTEAEVDTLISRVTNLAD